MGTHRMEVWQHLLIALLSASGFLVGRYIGNKTKEEVIYARRYLLVSGIIIMIAALAQFAHAMLNNATEFFIPAYVCVFIGLAITGSIHAQA